MTDDTRSRAIDAVLKNDGGTCHAFGKTHCFNDPAAKWEGRRCGWCRDWAATMVDAVTPILRPNTPVVLMMTEEINIRADAEQDAETEMRERLHDQVMALRPDEFGRVSLGLVVAMIDGDVT
jgi:hypothetical protein